MVEGGYILRCLYSLPKMALFQAPVINVFDIETPIAADSKAW